MKKLYTIIFLILIIISLVFFFKKEKVTTTFNEDDNIVVTYKISFRDPIDFKTYKSFFFSIVGYNYKIKGFKIDNNYNEYIKEKIDSINVDNSDYLDALDEYLTKCIKLLSDYDIDFTIDNNVKIKEVIIITNKKVIRKIETDNFLNNNVKFEIIS